MDTEPNCYEVTYRVYEGDNRAGGMVERTATVKELHEAIRYDNGGCGILSIKPKYIYVWDYEIPFEDLHAAVKKHKEIHEQRKQKEKIARLEQELAEAKARLKDSV